MVLRDGAGHAADPGAIEELERQGLAETDAERATFTDDGKALLGRAIAALRGAV